MQYKITVCYKMEDLLYIYAYTDIQLRIDWAHPINQGD